MVVGDRGGEVWKLALALAEGVDDADGPAAGVSSLCASRPRNKNPARTPLEPCSHLAGGRARLWIRPG
jgi:hypothetical protein